MSRTKVRWTSIEGLKNYVARGGKAGARHKVVLHMQGIPAEQVATRRSVSVALDVPVNEVSGRVNELVKDGVLIEHEDPVSCPVTGNTVHRISFNHAYVGSAY